MCLTVVVVELVQSYVVADDFRHGADNRSARRGLRVTIGGKADSATKVYATVRMTGAASPTFVVDDLSCFVECFAWFHTCLSLR